VAHELERFFEHLAKAVFDVACKVFLHIFVQADDADRLGDVDDIFLVPDGHGCGFLQRAAAGEWLWLFGSEVEVVVLLMVR
jgi:hypothetical protein